MSKAYDYRKLILFFTFQKNCDILFENNSSASVIKTFTVYVSTANHIYRKFQIPGWKNQDFSYMECRIRPFGTKAKTFFGSYQASCLRTSKWHALSHTGNSLKNISIIKYYDVNLFYESHGYFNHQYGCTSRKRYITINEKLTPESFKTAYENVQTKSCTTSARNKASKNVSWKTGMFFYR